MDGSEYGSGQIPKRGLPGAGEYRAGPSDELVKAAADGLKVQRGGIIFHPPTMVPYPGMGSGHSGSDSSRDRQVREDAAGLTASRQQAALDAVTAAAAHGITSGELENLLGIGHGQASSALSHLHRAGRISRVKDRRMTQEIYVLAEHIGERRESPYNPRTQRKHPKFHSDRTVLEAMKVADIAPTRYESIRKFLEALP